MLQTRTVQVKRVSDLATEREIHEFFSFSGEIENIEIRREAGESRIAFVTFKDPKALEIALLLSGATIVDQVVSIAPAENYISQPEIREVRIVDNAVSMSQENTSPVAEGKMSPNNGRVYISKAQDVVSSMLAKRVGLTEKLTVGISAVNSKVKSVDQRFQVSDKTMSALMAAERKLNDTGSAVKSSRYVAAGTAWLNGAFNKVAKAGQVAGVKTREKWNLAFSNLVAKDSPIAA
ncbi:UNVERIFIED_CONTAM: Binding partner of ACD11 1 [Sesamum calycinum]|uniref:Binding partner of ACD11 1 n=1 Tax=Sesamum calycinum TaxID=2727403 RepID=A0AAW2N3X9_9LAMI